MLKIDHEYLLHHIFEHSAIGLKITAFDGEVLSCNSSFSHFIGYDKEELYKMKVEAITHPDDLNLYISKMEMLNQGVISNYEMEKRYIHKDGHIVWGLLSVSLFQNELKINDKKRTTFIISQVQDITERKKAEDILKSSEKLYRLLVEYSQDLIIKRNLDGIYTYCSPASRSLIGYEPEEIVGTHYSLYIHPEDLSLFLNSDTLQTEPQKTITFRFKKKDGQYIWIESVISTITDSNTKKPHEFLAIIRDVHERMLLEQRIKANEQNILIEYPKAICISRNQKIIFANKSALKLIGAYAEADVVGQQMANFIPEEFHLRLKERTEKLDQGIKLPPSQYQLIRLNGDIIDVEIQSIPTIYNGERAYHTVINDITEIIRSRELLQQTEKLKIVGELAAGVAHEIRNPLTSIKGFIQLIENKLPGSDHIYADIMISEVDRINTIVGELLLLAKSKEVEFKELDVCCILNEVILLMESQALLNNVEIVQDIASSEAETCIMGVEYKIKQVFINIIKNAIEAMPESGRLVIKVEQKAKFLFVSFIDNGCGIPKEYINKIGQSFFTTKEKGTGLGVMISYSIIHSHNGEMKIKSKQGKGTTVQVVLPVIQNS